MLYSQLLNNAFLLTHMHVYVYTHSNGKCAYLTGINNTPTTKIFNKSLPIKCNGFMVKHNSRRITKIDDNGR